MADAVPPPATAGTSTAPADAEKPNRSLPSALALLATAGGSPPPPIPTRDGGGESKAALPTAASIWSSQGSHGVLDEEEGADCAAPPLSHPDLAHLDLASAWGAAAEAAVAGLAAPTTAPSALATLAADPHAPADLCESPTAWAGLLHCLPAVLSDAVTSEAAASLVAAVAATAAVENPPLLPDLAWAAVGGLEAGSAGATPPAAVACATTLLAHTLPRAWATFTPPVLGAAARALGRAVARDTTTTSPSAALLALSSTSASPTWLRRWAATPRVATVLWGVLGPEQVGLHARALVEGGGGALAVSATLVSAALATQAGRACVAHSDAPAAVLALAQLCGSADAGVSDTARVSCTALAACDGAPSLLPRPALLALVENEVTPALAALARTPRGADALLAAVNEGEVWPKAGAAALPPAVAAAVGSDQLGALHLTAHPAPGALAAAAASRSTPAGLAALTQAGLDPVMLADAWLKTASSWVPPGPPSPAWAVCAAAVALAALRPAAMAASVEAAVAGVAPTFEGPPVPPPPPAEEVAAVHDALGAAVARLLSE